MRIAVKIKNPLPGGATHTSEAQAKRYVKRGVAKMEFGVLVFHEIGHVFKSAEALAAERKLTTGMAYDRIRRRLTPREIRHIPIVNAGAIL